MRGTHVWIEDPTNAQGSVVAGATIESPEHERARLWYRVPASYAPDLTRAGDPFVLGTLFKAMRERTDLIVHGQVSPSLLRNLGELQAAWAAWRSDRYTKIDVGAESEHEQPRDADADATIMAFSGGVDSAFTALRHRRGRCGKLTRTVHAGVMVHGFDIPLSQTDAFNRAAEKSAKMLASIEMELIPMATNFRELDDDWEDAHGAAIASCLMLLGGGRFVAGLIASTEPYTSLVLPWGSNPLTDPLMSSETFRIIHDGAAFTRSEKIREIATWPEALRYLRVCWQGDEKDRNCGQCEKCTRTILNFRAVGAGLPECFEQDVSDTQIRGLKGLNAVRIAYLQEVLSVAKAESITDSWVAALEECLWRNRPGQGRVKRTIKRIPGTHRLWRFIRG